MSKPLLLKFHTKKHLLLKQHYRGSFLKRWGKFMFFFSLSVNFSSVKNCIWSFSLFFLVIYCFLLNQRNLESTKKLLVLLDMLLVASCAEKEPMDHAKCAKHGVKMVVGVSEMSHFSCSHHISLNVLSKTYDYMLNTRNHDKQQLKSHTAGHKVTWLKQMIYWGVLIAKTDAKTGSWERRNSRRLKMFGSNYILWGYRTLINFGKLYPALRCLKNRAFWFLLQKKNKREENHVTNYHKNKRRTKSNTINIRYTCNMGVLLQRRSLGH